MFRDEQAGSAVAHAAAESERDFARVPRAMTAAPRRTAARSVTSRIAAASAAMPASPPPPPPGVEAGTPAAPATTRRASQPGVRSAWAHLRTRATAPPPTEAEVARMIAEFQARGGQVTVCRAAHLLPIQNGAGRDANRWTA